MQTLLTLRGVFFHQIQKRMIQKPDDLKKEKEKVPTRCHLLDFCGPSVCVCKIRCFGPCFLNQSCFQSGFRQSCFHPEAGTEELEELPGLDLLQKPSGSCFQSRFQAASRFHPEESRFARKRLVLLSPLMRRQNLQPATQVRTPFCFLLDLTSLKCCAILALKA